MYLRDCRDTRSWPHMLMSFAVASKHDTTVHRKPVGQIVARRSHMQTVESSRQHYRVINAAALTKETITLHLSYGPKNCSNFVNRSMYTCTLQSSAESYSSGSKYDASNSSALQTAQSNVRRTIECFSYSGLTEFSHIGSGPKTAASDFIVN
jgi:hypothetical protein